MRLFLLCVCTMLLASCGQGARVTSHADWLKEATRKWQGETRARVIAAAEAVLRHADPSDTKFEYSQRGFVARRRFFIYAVIASAEGVDQWTFSTSENSDGAGAAVRIIQRGTAVAGQQSERFRDNQVLIGTFRLFWARLDYMLGHRPDWVGCQEAAEKLGLIPSAPGLDGLCSLTHQGRAAPPPPPLPRAQRESAPKQAPKGPPDPPSISDAETE